MTESVYKIIELVGTSTESWEKAARAAVDRASQSLRDLRVAEVIQLDMEGQVKVRPRHPPTVGQHTDEVLREAGYDEQSIKQFKQDGAVA